MSTLKDDSITIYEAMMHIKDGKYVMPAFQRQFVWSMEQIEKLWDSILLDYPIATFLFWHVDDNNVTWDPKKIFVLGVYASAVHAKWKKGKDVICQALAVASEPRIFWDGDPDEARAIIGRIKIPAELGTLEPARRQLNGPSAKVLDEHILAPLGYSRQDAWLCDCLPETRLNPSQVKVIEERYNPLIGQYGLNKVTIPKRPSAFCNGTRAEEITAELMESEAGLLVLLGDIPIAQYLKRVADVPYSTLQEYCDLYGYGNRTPVSIQGKTIDVLPLAHPRQIGALGAHSERWHNAHQEWEANHPPRAAE